MDERIEVTIGPDGRVVIHVQGIKGMACTDLTSGLIARLGGTVEQQALTLEAFETTEADPWAALTQKERDDA